MGIHLRPGHRVEEGKKGWLPEDYNDILGDIKIGSIDLGHWGEKAREELYDRHSPLYSIPNPWASAYLFNFVMNDNTHPLAEYLISQILNLLTDFAIYDNLEIVELSKPTLDSPFYKIWNLAPEFIKYNNSLWFFKDKEQDVIVGGLSKSSLVWTSQQYTGKRTIAELMNNQLLLKYLRGIYKLRKPVQIFDSFWHHNILSVIIKGSDHIIFEESIILPEIWLVKISPETDIHSDFYDADYKIFIFDEVSLRKDKQIFDNKPNPIGFIDQLIKRKQGDYLPMNMGNNKWVILDSLVEFHWIVQRKVEDTVSKGNLIKSLEQGYLFPIKPDYLQKYHLKLDDLKFDNKFPVNKGSQNASGEILWKNRRRVYINTQYSEDTRSIAIWPPFQSNYINNYVIEYDLKGFDNCGLLEFYDTNGNIINYTGPTYYSRQNFRVYKLSKNQFPENLRIIREYNDKLVGGYVKIVQQNKGAQQGQINIGIDFGTSHTSVAYSKGQNNALMKFTNANPIIITNPQHWFGMLLNFIPIGLAENKPLSETDWLGDERKPWQPFQTQWMDFSGSEKKLSNMDYIKDGIIPFLYYASTDTISNPVYENLKWGAPINISTFRKLFLRQLLSMIIVESEAIGFSTLSIKWSYPKAFSMDQLNNLNSFWDNALDELGIRK